jgi:hypothetical protein
MSAMRSPLASRPRGTGHGTAIAMPGGEKEDNLSGESAGG